ncbi:hypothetical protein KIK06_23525 [Nocardiopsis sp. EMB25]|uniref:hypothetical protein n=1 Tax=Nocardiopsis sp. EMB25 TaxID=2835867 RepID=UPI002283E0CA|nr:hypothetical protein [Nocardiopsis sp. EMB25]MCY9786858.1 hypothetical protein [Nocardiopsis sp. EMB25]
MTKIHIQPSYVIQVDDGHLTRHHIPTTRAGATGATVTVLILGEVRFVDSDAFINLGAAMADADDVFIQAHGTGLAYMHNAVEQAIDIERSFRIHDAESRAVRRASLERQARDGYLPADVLEREGGA